MKVTWAPGCMDGVRTEIPNDWRLSFLKYCENCGLAWEASHENESCPMAELEADFLPCFLEDNSQAEVQGGYSIFRN